MLKPAKPDTVRIMSMNFGTCMVRTSEDKLALGDCNGDNAVVSFSDGSSQSADMSQVVIYLNVSTDIRKVETFNFNGLIGDELHLSNIAEGTAVTIYDATGKVLQQVKATDTTLSLNTASLKNGVYVLKAGNQIVKFLKK